MGFSIVDQRATTLLAKTDEASNALQSAILEISTVRQLVDELQRAHLDTEFELKAVRGKAAPDGGDIPAVLQHEIALASAEQKFAEVDRASRMLKPRLSDERTPFTLTNGMADLKETLRAQDFREFANTRAILKEETVNEQTVLPRIKALAASQVAVATLNLVNADGQATAMAGADAAGESPLSDADLEEALAASLRAEEALTERLEARFEALATANKQALSRWQALFPITGPPPIEFLGHPAAKAKAAGDWQSLKRYDRALALLTEAAATLNSWAKEVEDLRARCHDRWTKAQAEGRAFENALGMRFVRIGDAPDSSYWSIWETRVMDFAWFAHHDVRGSKNAGTFWKDPGFPIGPTSPVVGIEPDLASDFGQWIVPYFRATSSEDTYGLPSIESYEALLAREPGWRALVAKRAVFPENNRLKSQHWQIEYADPDISPERHIRPVGLGEPSAQGLHDLFGNAWEWAGDLLSSKGQANHHGRDYQFHALYGGGSFGQIGFNGDEPPAGNVFVGRHDALGFRFVINTRTVEERLRSETIRSPESQFAPP